MMCPMPTVPGPDGKPIPAVDADFHVLDERVHIYETKEPAVRVRMRTVVIRVLVARDKDGKPVKNQNGEPIVQVFSQNIVTTEVVD